MSTYFDINGSAMIYIPQSSELKQAKTTEEANNIIQSECQIIIEKFKNKIQELTKQNEFLYKDLPNMVKLSEKFIEMKKQSVRTEEINRDLDETLLLIKTLSHSISKNYHEILMDDVNVIKHQVDFDK